MKKVTYHLELGSSQHGSSKYEKMISCGKAAALAAEDAASGHRGSVGGHFGVGTLYHAFMEMYFKGQIHAPDEVLAVEFVCESEIEPDALDEARRLAREFMMRFGASLYGEILFNELALPRNEKEAPIIEEAIGISPWTGRIDMGFRVGKKHLTQLENAGLQLPSPGSYLLDFKSYGSEDGALRERLRWSHQATGYMLAYNALHAKKLVPHAILGCVFDVVIKTKSPRFLRFFTPPPSDAQIMALKTRWLGAEVLSRFLPAFPNAGDYTCFPMGKACTYWTQGRCNRTYTEEEFVQIRNRLSQIPA